VTWTSFNRDQNQLLKAHYRKDKKSRYVFEQLVESYLDQITAAPYVESVQYLTIRGGIENESFPKNAQQEGFNFRKVRFLMPGLTKLARYGRLMYVVYDAEFLIFPISIYTHLEYPKRPPDKELKHEFALIKAYIEENSE
jgi:hypothetical protein